MRRYILTLAMSVMAFCGMAGAARASGAGFLLPDQSAGATIIRDRVRDLAMKGQTLDQIKAARVTVDYDRRYSTPAWTGDQLVESIVATLPPPEGSPAAGRNGRQ